MAQFMIYRNLRPSALKTYPYLLDIQSDLLDGLRTTVVIPLTPLSAVQNLAISRLCPIMEVGSEKFVALTPQLSGIDRATLGPLVGDYSHYRSEIIAAVDFMLAGV